jgi:hypothetical protein
VYHDSWKQFIDSTLKHNTFCRRKSSDFYLRQKKKKKKGKEKKSIFTVEIRMTKKQCLSQLPPTSACQKKCILVNYFAQRENA